MMAVGYVTVVEKSLPVKLTVLSTAKTMFAECSGKP